MPRLEALGVLPDGFLVCKLRMNEALPEAQAAERRSRIFHSKASNKKSVSVEHMYTYVYIYIYAYVIPCMHAYTQTCVYMYIHMSLSLPIHVRLFCTDGLTPKLSTQQSGPISSCNPEASRQFQNVVGSLNVDMGPCIVGSVLLDSPTAKQKPKNPKSPERLDRF